MAPGTPSSCSGSWRHRLVNPSLVPGGAGEGKIAEFVAGWADRAGLEVEVLDEAAGRPSVIVRSGRTGAGRTLLLCGHLDTVGVSGVVDPLTPRIDGDRLYGRGSYDMKAGLAAALVACRDAVSDITGEVVVAAVADEEHSSFGVQQVLRHAADAAIVTEPTELAVATAHKGFVWTEIHVTGKAAHGSRPHLGVDAILKTGPILVALEDLDRRLRRRQHMTLGPGNLHASLIAGGLEESTIPDTCVLTVERRTLPGETTADVEADIAVLLTDCRNPQTPTWSRPVAPHWPATRSRPTRRRSSSERSATPPPMSSARCHRGGELLVRLCIHLRRRHSHGLVRAGRRRRPRRRRMGQPDGHRACTVP